MTGFVNDACDILIMGAMMTSYYFVVVKHSENRWKRACEQIKSHGEGAVFIASGLVWVYAGEEKITLPTGHALTFLSARPYGASSVDPTMISPDAVTEFLDVSGKVNEGDSVIAEKSASEVAPEI